jgi:SAM-dependent methyltransferase
LAEAFYNDRRLAAVYDAFNPPAHYHRFYLDLAGREPRDVLDMGCGTGWLAVALADRGHRVVGVDPASGMLSVAQSRPRGNAVRWVLGSAATFHDARRFDLIFMTGHAFQTLQTDDEIVASLSNLRDHLAEGGRLAFETRNPDAREWQGWTPAQTLEMRHVPGLGRVGLFNSIDRAELPYVVYRTHFRFPDGEVRSEPAALRFVTVPELAHMLAAAGFASTEFFGDWDRAPLSEAAPEIIVLAS